VGSTVEALDQQRRYDLCYSLYHARKQLAAVPAADVNLRADVLHRIRLIESQLGTVDERAFYDFCLNIEAAEKERKRIIRERAYERTGAIARE
jgi:hypothetical protein